MIRALILSLLALLAAPTAAQSVSDQPHTRIEIIAESRTPAAGQPLTIGLQLTPKPGWHTYWANPGDAGAPTRVAWTLPAGTPEPSALAYPLPETLIVSGLMNYVYAHPNVLLTTVTPPAGLAKGAAFAVTVKADWLVCSLEQCVPESATLTLPLTIGDGATDPETGVRVALARAALPKPVDWPATFAIDKGRFVLAVPFGSIDKVKSAYFFPAVDGVVDYVAPQTLTIAGDRLRLETAALAVPGSAAPDTITGVLRVEREGEDKPLGFAITARPGAVPAAGAPIAAAKPGSEDPGLPLILLGAVLGGIILNIMPCVFPILSLKALSLAGGNIAPAAARRDALAYTAGVVLVCAALGGLVLLLRAAGSQVGWAFQLQDPRVITGLLLLVTAIALNLAGLFEITLSTGSLGDDTIRKGGAMGSFATGALAAFVATPCTGPFMAGALGAALVLPPVAAIAVFAGLGFGLALPFLAIGFIPALRRRLPRPGAWMIRLRAILSIPMFLTALALAWVLGRQAGVEGMTGGLAGALLVGLFLWWLGRRQHSGQTGWLPLGGLIAASIAAIALLPIAEPAIAGPTAAPAGLNAQRFSPETLASLRAAKTPVFLYMTADWCLTCKVNEKGAMADSAVAAAFKAKGIAVLEGDWTRGDPVISEWLAAQKRAGVPVYVFYATDGSETELPQILTVKALTALG
ncbi:MAG: thiol:disulfide interchange protein [Alphaproteobacteria bacterium PA4]|nr:MAG: thiol:disulfide interchange protein [Alphaproteobacteria bacterium PA4]